jgi:hypothetical protein
LALLPLAELEELRGNPRAAVELRRAADVVRDLLLDPAWSSRLVGLAANPEDMRTYVDAMRDSRLPAGVRAEALEGGPLGFCLNPREILRGPQPRRLAVVRFAADSIRDFKEAASIAALVTRAWQNDQPPKSDGKPFVSGLTRIAFCTNIGRT